MMNRVPGHACLVLLAVVGSVAVAKAGPQTLPAKPDTAAALIVWRHDLMERVSLKSTATTVTMEALKARDSRKRLDQPGTAKWIAIQPKTGANGKPEPVEIVGCRNGAFSGQVVVASPDAVKVSASELKTDDGKATVPSSAIHLRYGIVDGGSRERGTLPWFDGLEDLPADGVIPRATPALPVQPVWVTVQVPKDAVPGRYAGTLAIRCGTTQVDVPVRLTVVDWALPDTKDFGSHLGVMQSPESLALKYKAPLWSEEHWKLIEKSFALLAGIGNKELYITAIERTHFGNEHSMVRYIKQDDGTYRPDLSIAERYVDLALKHYGKPPVVCLYVWEYYAGYGWHASEADPKFNKKQEQGVTFSIVDPKTGALSSGTAPNWGTPESKAFWKPVLDGMQAMLRKRGLEKSLMLGLAGDARPPRIAETDFRDLAPDVRWVLQSHPYQDKLWAQPLGLGAFVWGARQLKPAHATDLQCGWKPKPSGMIYCAFPRGGFCIGLNRSTLRFSIENALAAGMNGISRTGADFWPVDLGMRRPVCIVGRYGGLPGAIKLDIAGNPSWLSAGKDGPISSAAFETVREGIQDAEARILMERALADPATAARLGPDLEKRCREVLADRVGLMLAIGQVLNIGTNENKVTVPEYLPIDWQAQSERLFATAGEVATKLAK